ncbi:MAG: hypothetical protein JNL90_04010 [Planctomycetes bacterium]|nr:hypothetical protein [Planctomycetota bacterium]
MGKWQAIGLVASGVAAGVVLGHLTSGGGARHTIAPPAPRTTTTTEGLAEARSMPEAERVGSGEGRSTAASPDELLGAESAARDASDGASTSSAFAEELRARGRVGIARGWAALRPDPLPSTELDRGLAELEATVEKLPESIGAKLARAATEREQSLRLGSAAELLATMEESKAVDPAFVRDAGRFDALFERRSATEPFDGRELIAGAHGELPALQDGALLSFPAGVFDPELDELFIRQRPMPRDVTIAGAGIDQTLLCFDDLHVFGDVVNLTLRDFTFFNDGCLFDLRGKTRATITVERVRVTGFDCGAGGSSALNLAPTALRAIDCVFAGGFGDSPYNGYLCDVRVDGFLARFDRCRFEHLTLWHTPRDAWQLVFAGCTFDHVAASSRKDGTLPAGIEFVGGVPAFGSPAPPGDPPAARDLDALFPGWREKLDR